ncbi:MAG TPA: hypothetical protein VIS29_21445 [Streptomyces sp.]
MRSMPITVGAAAAVAAIALSAPAALADSPHKESEGSVSVRPSTISPGEEVELRVDACGKGKWARGSSEAFVSEARFAPAGDKGLYAEARIRSDAEPHTYDIRVTCADGHGKATGTVTVVRRGEPTPVAPVRAGGGGTADIARQDGPGTPQAVTGIALAVAAGLAVALRSARRRRTAQD